MYIFFRFFFAIFLFPICFPVVFPRCVSPGGWVQVLGPAFLLTRARVKRARALAEKRLYGSKSSSQTWWTCHSLQIKVWFLLFYNVFFFIIFLTIFIYFQYFPDCFHYCCMFFFLIFVFFWKIYTNLWCARNWGSRSKFKSPQWYPKNTGFSNLFGWIRRGFEKHWNLKKGLTQNTGLPAKKWHGDGISAGENL
jgi:hypothetical protein